MTTSVVSPGQLRLGVIFIAIAATLWGTVGIATRALFLISDANPLSVGFFRLALASPVLLLATYLTLGRAGFRIQGRDFWLMLGLGLSMALYQVTYFAAIERLGVTVAVLIALCTCPVMVAILAAPLLKERLTATVGIAMVLALLGTVLLVGGGPDLGRDRNQMMIGVMLALGTGLSYAFVTMTSRALAPRYHPLQPISLGFTAGALMILPFALAGGLVLDYPPLGWLLLLHLGLIPTAFGYILFLRGMRTTSATVASILTLFEPLTSTVLAWWLFQERLGPLGFLGAALLLGAMFILMRGEREA
ncbi:EamA family transporter [Candidatus Chloroploca sp. M-50]|uniref:EamA family transporter n=1 Tax=Candidatus Chloroploca mongolica TaxID=2528176 RepID=A0ABS4D7V7_9CHLR|nr:EamA family transporter [Candidatus Chloroploca mongolica]MBP1465525.1 EamA family transporter [Candidatus Chloroploca mongolica]